jgi:AcrR family transcriptional regulator
MDKPDMRKPVGETRRRRDREGTRRRVLDAVVASVIEVGYYKSSSNEIARRAGVSWGSIDHLFGSREQLMLDVVNDLGAQLEPRFADATIEGSSLEERLASVLGVLATHYEQGSYLVQMQILLDLSANPKMSPRDRRAVRQNDGEQFDRLAHPLFEKALGDVAAEADLVFYAFMTMRGYLASAAFGRLVAEFRHGAVIRLIDQSIDESVVRELLVRGIASTIRDEAKRRGYTIA